MKRILVVVALALAGLAVYRRLAASQAENELWAEASQPAGRDLR